MFKQILICLILALSFLKPVFAMENQPSKKVINWELLNGSSKINRTMIAEAKKEDWMVKLKLDHSLLAAIKDGDLDQVQALLQQGANPNTLNQDDKTPLMESRSAALCKVLLEHGADVNMQSFGGHTALAWAACRENNDSVLSLLLAHNANPNIQCKMGKTALIHAAKRSLLSNCKILLAHGANSLIQGPNAKTALIVAARQWAFFNRLYKESLPDNRSICVLLVEHETIHTKQFIAFLFCCKQVCPRFYRQKDLLKELWKNWSPEKLLSQKDCFGKAAYDYYPVDWLKPKDISNESL